MFPDTGEPWIIGEISIECDPTAPFTAALLFPTPDNQQAALLLEPVILNALIGDLTAIDAARAAAAGYGPAVTDEPTFGRLQKAMQRYDPGDYNVADDVVPVATAWLEWDQGDPDAAELSFIVDITTARLPLPHPMKGLLGDLSEVSRLQAVQSGWLSGEDNEPPPAEQTGDGTDGGGGKAGAAQELLPGRLQRTFAERRVIMNYLDRVTVPIGKRNGQPVTLPLTTVLAIALVLIVVIYAIFFL